MSQTIWQYFLELRKELLEAQKIRAQIIGFKVTFVSAAIGLIVANLDKGIDQSVFVMPAFAAICFDFLISSYSFSIKRIGSYVRDHVEPALRRSGDLPEDFVAWQEFLTDPKTRQNLAGYGNMGLTILAVCVAVWALIFPFRPVASSILLVALIVFSIVDVLAYLEPRKLGKLWSDGT